MEPHETELPFAIPLDVITQEIIDANSRELHRLDIELIAKFKKAATTEAEIEERNGTPIDTKTLVDIWVPHFRGMGVVMAATLLTDKDTESPFNQWNDAARRYLLEMALGKEIGGAVKDKIQAEAATKYHPTHRDSKKYDETRLTQLQKWQSRLGLRANSTAPQARR